MKRVFFAAFLLSFTFLYAQKQGPELYPEVEEKTAPKVLNLYTSLGLEPAIVQQNAFVSEKERVEEIYKWNKKNKPIKIGLVRFLKKDLSFKKGTPFFTTTLPSGEKVVTFGIKIEKAKRLRLRLDNVKVPKGTIFTALNPSGEEVRSFDTSIIDHKGGIWTPSIGGDQYILEIHLPKEANLEDVEFTISRFAEIIFDRENNLAPRTSHTNCLQDAMCYGNSTLQDIDLLRDAIGWYDFVSGGSIYYCSGGLINDLDTSSYRPLFLTANHCISTQSEASSAEFYFKDYTDSCNGSSKPLGNLDTVVGSTLLETGAYSDGKPDFTLLELSSLPPNSVLLGWDASTGNVTDNMKLHRISHPFPDNNLLPEPQTYNQIEYDDSPSGTCTGVPTSVFMYSEPKIGGTYGGSSGAPVVKSGLMIVGQLLGACGPTPDTPCDMDDYEVDGRFSETYQYIQNHLAGGGGGGGTCTADTYTHCFQSGRFRVTVDWRDQNNNTGQGRRVDLTDASGLFWFFSPDNIEMLVKVLDGCAINNYYWVLFAATTDQEFTLTITDVVRGSTKTYFNPLKHMADAVIDVQAFRCN